MVMEPFQRVINEANITVSRAVSDLAEIERKLKEASPVPLPELPMLSDALKNLTEVSKQLWIRVGMPPKLFRETRELNGSPLARLRAALSTPRL